MARCVPSRLRCRSLAGALAATALTVAGVLAGGGSASASATPAPSPVRAGSYYLALGDSVAFGYRESTNLPTPDYSKANSFVGYPEDVGAALGLHVINASCPGETSSSFIATHVTSNGCENSPTGPVGYRTFYPLHVRYSGTQMSYAIHYLQTHPATHLVTLMIGANDAFLCEETTSDHCASELKATLRQITANVRTILTNLRFQAGYHGQIVIVNYYSLDYASATDNASSRALNSAMDLAGRSYHVTVADGYGAFERAAVQSGGDTCAAGLLTKLTTGGCGVHPSIAGQSLLALAVERALTH